MNKDDDFFHYSGILAIKLGFDQHNGCGITILNEENALFLELSLIRAFAPGAPIINNMMEVLKKLFNTWEKKMGFRYRPLVLCIEYPESIEANSVRSYRDPLMQFCGMLRIKFNPKMTIMPQPHQWKIPTIEISDTNKVLQQLKPWQLKGAQQKLSAIPSQYRLNVVDSIGLALYAHGKLESGKDCETKQKITA